MKLFCGYSDFGSVIDARLDFVDKSLFIQKILQDPNQVICLTRPRRFGKSFNLSMLRYFFAAEVLGRPTHDLFKGLKIENLSVCMNSQGQHPVVFLSLKDLIAPNYDEFCQKLNMVIGEVYQEHRFLLETDTLYDDEKKQYESVLNGLITPTDAQKSLYILTKYLHRHTQKKVIILIDEYDTPLQSAYLEKYYDKAIHLIRGFLSPALKDNLHLEKAVLTGILRVAKESLFSGLNNIKVHTVLGKDYGPYFGFTESEVKTLFEQSGLSDQLEEARRWYNGYQIGNTKLYNPWSIVNCIQEDGACKPYWINTSGNDLVKTLLIESSVDFKHDFEQLLAGHTIHLPLSEYFVFSDLKTNESLVWSLLLMTGYLKVVGFQLNTQGKMIYSVEIPNQEIRNLYDSMIEQWLFKGKSFKEYDAFLNDLLTGNIESFSQRLEHVMLQIASFHDMAREPEAFYQGLMLGLIVGLRGEQYEIKSNRESGLGRYDIIIIPKDTNALGIILELKSVKSAVKEDALQDLLDQESKVALTQIETQGYSTEFKQRGHQHILNIGIAFCGKQLHTSWG